MKRIRKSSIINLLILSMLFVSCSDDLSFSASSSHLLTLGTDTLCLDTLFSNTPSAHKQFLVYNYSGDGIRIANTRLEKGNQTGYRVNVNGSYLGAQTGWQVNDLELRNGDSLRVFVEITSAENKKQTPQEVLDNLVFTLESGNKQKVALQAWSWDAKKLESLTISQDTTLSGEQPLIVHGNLTIPEGKTLTIAPGTTLYFHNDAGIDVFGTLKAIGTKENQITLRCDRLDRMVSNLTYDNNPGQWGGIRFRGTSSNNEMTFVDLHGGTHAVVCDSAHDALSTKLRFTHSSIHNCKGNGIAATNSKLIIENSIISNTLDTCLNLRGGNVTLNHTTIAQYYPFDSRRGHALVYGTANGENHLPLTLDIKNSIIKGYNDDVIYRATDTRDSLTTISFSHSLLRTPTAESNEFMTFENCIFENPEDTMTNGRNSFKLFDTNFFFYDFTPNQNSAAIGAANPSTSLPTDRNGNNRNPEHPDMGCYIAAPNCENE